MGKMNKSEFKEKINTVICGDAQSVLRTFPNECIDMCCSSPPYWGLRDYGVDGQLGLEKTPEEYVAKMVEIFGEVKRVLKPEGTLWLNLGDTYSSHKDCKSIGQTLAKGTNRETAHEIDKGKSHSRNTKALKSCGLKNKDLIGIPWRVAFALQADGWYLRQDIIWHKPNPMPESVRDRCTKAHEYIFLLSKQPKYYCDMEAIKEDAKDAESYSGRRERNAPQMYHADRKNCSQSGSVKENGKLTSGQTYPKVNKRSVWTVTTKPYSEAHFATFPPDLIEPCILAGCPKGGVVLDPFMGAFTTALVAYQQRRNYIGCELSPAYIKLGEKRIKDERGKFGLFENNPCIVPLRSISDKTVNCFGKMNNSVC